MALPTNAQQRQQSPAMGLRQVSEGFRRRLRDLQRRRKPRRVFHPNSLHAYELAIEERIRLLLDTQPSWLIRQERYPKSDDNDYISCPEPYDSDGLFRSGVVVKRQLSQASTRWTKSESLIDQQVLVPLMDRWHSSSEMQGVELLHKSWGEVMEKVHGGGTTGGVYGIFEVPKGSLNSPLSEQAEKIRVPKAKDNIFRSPQFPPHSLRTASSRDDTTSHADFMFSQVRLYVGDGSAAPPD